MPIDETVLLISQVLLWWARGSLVVTGAFLILVGGAFRGWWRMGVLTDVATVLVALSIHMVPSHVRMLYRWVRYREGATQQARAYIRRYDG